MSRAKPEAGTHEAELGLILDTIPQAVIVADAKHNIRYANAGAESMFGASSTHLARNRLDRFVPFGSPVLSLIERAINKQEPVNEYQIDISSPRNRHGTVVDVHAAPMEALGELVLLTFRERGMPDRIDRQLTHRGAARSVTGLASMLAHEIKNPLSGIRGAAQLLESVVGEGDRELAQLITSETDRIVKILDRMEVFSDETPIEREPVNMHLVLGRIRQIAENGFGKNVRFVEAYDPSLPDVAGSHDQLVQVFLNLVKNAAEAMDGERERVITLSSAYRAGIRMAAPGGRERASLPLEFTVSDTGPGIPEDIRTHIFEPFVTTRINGSGLGLALVAKIIGLHGGVIECDSHSTGTVFRILLPAWKPVERAKGGRQ